MSAHTIPAAIFADTRIGSHAFKVYTLLAADPQATVTDLAADSDGDPGTVRAALAELEDAGWLRDGAVVR